MLDRRKALVALGAVSAATFAGAAPVASIGKRAAAPRKQPGSDVVEAWQLGGGGL